MEESRDWVAALLTPGIFPISADVLGATLA